MQAVEKWFAEVDNENSGGIKFPEFLMMMTNVNGRSNVDKGGLELGFRNPKP